MKLSNHHIILACIGFNSCAVEQRKTEKPNIILILADDLGYSDLGCYGSEIHTPNLDSLAAHGVRCSHFYNTSRSCPSRASLMTGLYPHQAGMGHMSFGLKLKPENEHIESYQGYLSQNVPTIADLLSASGYQTCISGKWHIGDEEEHWPGKHGFQHGCYIPTWGSPYFSTEKEMMSMQTDTGCRYYPDTNVYMTDIITDNALQLMSDVPEGKPFFLYLAYNAPHTPLQAPDSLIEKYMPVYKDGWEQLRQSRFGKLKELGMIPGNFTEPGRQDKYADLNYDWSRLNEKEKWYMQRTMATYAAMVDRMDQNIGRLISYLKKSEKLENTIILFMSDNGGSNEGTNYHMNSSMTTGIIPGTKGTYCGPGPWWGRLSNTPYRMFKTFENEGGIASPFIIYNPDNFPQNKIIKNTYFHIIDVLPTCLELAGVQYPDTFNSLPVKQVFHKSMLPSLKKENPCADTLGDRLICWEHQGQIGVHKGKWKLTFIREVFYVNPLTGEDKSEMVNQWGLFDLEKDPFENNNVYDKYPEVVKELKKDYDEWAEKTGVVEWDKVNIWK